MVGTRGKPPDPADCDPIVQLVSDLVRGTRWGRLIGGFVAAIVTALSTYAAVTAEKADDTAETTVETTDDRIQREAELRAELEEQLRAEQAQADLERQDLAGQVGQARTEAARANARTPAPGGTDTRVVERETVKTVPVPVPGPTVTARPSSPPTPRPFLPPLIP